MLPAISCEDYVSYICRSVDHGYVLPLLLKIRNSPLDEIISARIYPLFLTLPVLLDESGAFQRGR